MRHEPQRSLADRILHQLPRAVAVVQGAELCLISANPCFLETFSLPEAALGRPLSDVLPHLHTPVAEQLQALIDGRTASVTQHTTTAAPAESSGHATRKLKVDYTRLPSSADEPPLAMISCTHTHEARPPLEAQEPVLRARELGLKLALRTAPIAVYTRDLDMRLAWAQSHLWGTSADGILGTRPEDIYPAEDAAMLTSFYRDVLASGEPTRACIRLTPIGATEPVWIDITAQPAEDANGTVIGVACATFDLTEMARAYGVSEQSRALLRMALDVGPMAEWQYDFATNEILHSESLPRLYGLKPRRGTSDPGVFLRYVHPTDLEKMGRRFTRAFANGTNELRNKFRILRPDGSIGWIESRGRIYRDRDGDPTKIVGIEADITESQRAVDSLRRSNTDLERFAFAASHDLKEPLRTVGAFATLLEQRYAERLDEPAREFLSFIRRGTERMEALVDGLLNYARLSETEAQFDAVDLEKALSSVLEQVASTIEEAHGSVTRERLPVVRGNEVMIAHVLQNLVSNAMKFAQPGVPPHLHVSAMQRGSLWLIKMQDNGRGIDPSSHELIFEPFRRLAEHRDVPGSGLGLSLCKRIIERHGGEIWCESAPGQGAVFYFTLPGALPLPSSRKPA